MKLREIACASCLALPLQSGAATAPLTLDCSLDTPVVLAGGRPTAYLRVALKGAEPEPSGPHTPVNLALVLDRSGSMSGEKLAEAKRAAIMAVGRLRADDIVSVVTYDSTVRVLVPATKVGDPAAITELLQGVQAGSSTALFAGVSKGARELRKFLAAQRVNRVLLLSDGLANVGPSSPGELAELGASLAKEGIAVTTVGLGLDYNEELMTRLAEHSDGNHYFAERATDLAQAFERELGEVMSVVALDLEVAIELPQGVRPLRVLGRDAEIRGQHIVGRLNQMYARQTKYFLIQVELPAGRAGHEQAVAEVRASYVAGRGGVRGLAQGQAKARYAAETRAVDAGRNVKVAASVARQVATEQNQTAMKLRDDGKVDEAKALLLSNAQYLRENAGRYGNKFLADDAAKNEVDAINLDPARWKRQRKQMQADQQEQLRGQGYIEVE